MAITSMEWAIRNKVDSLQGSLIQMLDEYNPVWPDLPVVMVDGRTYEYARTVTLPTTSWRGYNQAWTESTGVMNPIIEYPKTFGGEAKVDVALVRQQPARAPDLMQQEIKMRMLSASNEISRAFFEGSELNSAHEPVGLRARIAGDQLILNASGGGTLTLAKLNSLVDAVPFTTRQEEGMQRGEGIRKVLYMNRTLRSKIDALIEAQTGAIRINVEKDTFGRRVERYRDADIKVVETTGTGVTILDFDEDPGDGVSDTASIYCVAYADDLVHGFRPKGNGRDILMVQRFGGKLGIESEPRLLTRFEGDIGFAIDHPRGAARLYGITNT
jgi:hypothetical protein